MEAIVLDTNCLLQILPRRSPHRWLFDFIREGQVRLIISTEILMEYAEILEQQINHEVADNVIQALIDSPFVQMTVPTYRWQIIQEDPDDDKFVDAAIAASAAYLITNNGHFKVLDTTTFPKVNRLRLDDLSPSLFT
ncbi:MAG: putative toxin-antitoxin system toxin component, PIN family [Tunicatimonas sp.]